jgi:hypothetical protein
MAWMHACVCVRIDVNSQDLSIGLSFPPQPFVTPSFIATLRTCLTPRGLLLFNFGCRSPSLRSSILTDLQSVFPSVCELPVDGDVNAIIACQPFAIAPPPNVESLTPRLPGAPSPSGVRKLAPAASFPWPDNLSFTSLTELLADLRVHSPTSTVSSASSKKKK